MLNYVIKSHIFEIAVYQGFQKSLNKFAIILRKLPTQKLGGKGKRLD